MTIQSKAMPPSNTNFRYQILSNQLSNIIRKCQATDFQPSRKALFLFIFLPAIHTTGENTVPDGTFLQKKEPGTLHFIQRNHNFVYDLP